MSADTQYEGGPKPVGEILRYWRGRKKMSQMDLALSVDVSTRHLSFVETGRSRPSRDLVLRLGQALELPLRQCNALLGAAGYAAEYGHTPLEAEQMVVVRRTLRRLLDSHAPYPALVLDSAYEILMTNAAFDRIITWFAGEAALVKYTNIYRLTFAEDGLRGAFRDWPLVAQFMLTRLLGEALATQEAALFKLHAELCDHQGSENPMDSALDQNLPIFSFTLERGGLAASFFSTITTFGTPLDVTAQELRIESIFPADPATQRLLQEAAEAGGSDNNGRIQDRQ
jgi:transcriptional regulator with XRE-family HTH domain